MKDLFVHSRLFIALGLITGLYTLAFLVPVLLPLAHVALLGLVVFSIADLVLLFASQGTVTAGRILPERFSNGDANPVRVWVKNQFRFPLSLQLIDEVPEQFQWRNMSRNLSLAAGSQAEVAYQLRPVKRGEYRFGRLILMTRSPLSLWIRRFRIGSETTVPVYPGFLQMQKFQLLAMSNRLNELGVKPIRRLGHTTEFDQIKDYVRGDDVRTINWQATARSSRLMVNQFMDERSQPVYCLIDKSRNMKMPFEGMSLLDYAINATLIMSNVAIQRQDRAGLLAFAKEIDQFLPASNQGPQLRKIQEALYRQETDFRESDYERLYAFISRTIPHRSLLLLFTNFESVSGMQRQLPFLQRLAKQHLLVVVFFENTELRQLISSQPGTTEEVYIKAIGEQFSLDKKLIVKELKRRGIHSILTPPQHLTINTINKYLAIKARGEL